MSDNKLVSSYSQIVDYLGIQLTTYAVGEGTEKTFYVLAADLLHNFDDPQIRGKKSLEATLGIALTTRKITAKNSIGRNTQFASILLEDVSLVLLALIKKGNQKALEKADLLVANGLHNIARLAFGLEVTKVTQKTWCDTRLSGIAARRGLTDSIKEWYEEYPGGTSCPYGVMFGKVTNLIYDALWGMTAAEIERELDCKHGKIRDTIDTRSLYAIEAAEKRVMKRIDKGIKPDLAVIEADLDREKAFSKKIT